MGIGLGIGLGLGLGWRSLSRARTSRRSAAGGAGSWKASADVMTLLGSPSQRCFSLPGLPARTHSTLPPIKLEWGGGLKTLDLELRVEQSAAAGGEVP